jgi:hypothetical protein
MGACLVLVCKTGLGPYSTGYHTRPNNISLFYHQHSKVTAISFALFDLVGLQSAPFTMIPKDNEAETELIQEVT